MRIPITAALVLASVFCQIVFAQAAPAVPNELAVPPDRKLVLTAHATGAQIYVCDGVWKFKAPAATLSDEYGKEIGSHFAGPTWRLTDGSAVVGKVAATLASPDPTSIPWLLLNAADHTGGGALSYVLSIQRLNTKGGKAPASGCDDTHKGQESRVSYSADYYFYSDRR